MYRGQNYERRMDGQSRTRTRQRDAAKNINDERSHESRYTRSENLSPFRSPLRPETKDTDNDARNRRGSERYSQKRRTWKALDSLENTNLGQGNDKLSDYSTPDYNKFTPESRKYDDVLAFRPSPETPRARHSSTSSKASSSDWGSMVEDYEERAVGVSSEIESYRRRLETFSCGQMEFERDQNTLVRRQKQLELGKNTDSYSNYVRKVPRTTRTKIHPKTPNKFSKVSRRSWDMQIRLWRRQLHIWAPDSARPRCSSVTSNSSNSTIDSTNSDNSQAETPGQSLPNNQSADLVKPVTLGESSSNDPELTGDLMNFAIGLGSKKEPNFFDEFDLDSCLEKEDDAFLNY